MEYYIIPGLLQKIVATFTALLNLMQCKGSCAVYSCHTSFPTQLLVLPFSLNYGENQHGSHTDQRHGLYILSAGRCLIEILLQVEYDKQQLQSVGHVSCHR